eukprot:8451730-Pyramimonas_sp.AAC.1
MVRERLASHPALEKFATPDDFIDKNGFHHHVAKLHLEVLQEDLLRALESHDGQAVSRQGPVISRIQQCMRNWSPKRRRVSLA